jgi:hypothetical protein
MYNVKVMVPEQQRVQSVTILLSSKYKKTYKINIKAKLYSCPVVNCTTN